MTDESDDKRRARRHALLDISLRKQRPGAGVLTLRHGPFRGVWPDLTAVLRGLRWAIVGAVATRYYMPERATQDIDIAVAAADLEAARERLGRAGYTQEGVLAIGRTQWRSASGVRFDVLEAGAGWWATAFAEAAANPDEHGCPVLTRPYLVLMKAQAMRPQDTADISRMLGFASDEDIERVRAVVREHAPADAEDLESMIALGRLEHRSG